MTFTLCVVLVGAYYAGLAVRNDTRSSSLTSQVLAALSHADGGHLWGNVVSIIFIGAMVEMLFGPVVLMAVFWAGALGAGRAETLWGPHVWTLGSSGGVYALNGMLLAATGVAAYRARQQWRRDAEVTGPFLAFAVIFVYGALLFGVSAQELLTGSPSAAHNTNVFVHNWAFAIGTAFAVAALIVSAIVRKVSGNGNGDTCISDTCISSTGRSTNAETSDVADYAASGSASGQWKVGLPGDTTSAGLVE